MDRPPTPPPPELKYDDAEEEQERGINLPFMKEDDEEVDEYGVEGFRCENGELLLAREDEAIEFAHQVGDSADSEQQDKTKKQAEKQRRECVRVLTWL